MNLASRPRIIGVTGYSGAGKDEAAKVLITDFGYKRLAFADGVREFVYKLNPKVVTDNGWIISVAELVDNIGWDLAKKHKEVRQLLINTGMAAREMFGPDVWVSKAFRKMKIDENYVITDVRFENERNAILKANGSTVRIINAKITEPPFDSPSEKTFTNENWQGDRIFNNNDLVFYADVRDYMRKICQL